MNDAQDPAVRRGENRDLIVNAVRKGGEEARILEPDKLGLRVSYLGLALRDAEGGPAATDVANRPADETGL